MGRACYHLLRLVPLLLLAQVLPAAASPRLHERPVLTYPAGARTGDRGADKILAILELRGAREWPPHGVGLQPPGQPRRWDGAESKQSGARARHRRKPAHGRAQGCCARDARRRLA